ncbi:DNA-binding transcriptional regulator AraC, partial [Vibrio anguillarum]|nr:DNA-binding transcriptional regulator AraC [Vibrio anguillarum]
MLTLHVNYSEYCPMQNNPLKPGYNFNAHLVAGL